MAKIYHPDINHSEGATDMFILVREAYSFLYDFYKDGNNPSKKENTFKENIKNDKFYEDWYKQNRDRARKQATYEAKMRFENFKKTKVYKTAKIFSRVLNLVILFSGIFIIIAAYYGLLQRGLIIYVNGVDKVNIDGIVAAFFVSIVGLLLIIFSHVERKQMY